MAQEKNHVTAIFPMLKPLSVGLVSRGKGGEASRLCGIPARAITWIVMPAGNGSDLGNWGSALPVSSTLWSIVALPSWLNLF